VLPYGSGKHRTGLTLIRGARQLLTLRGRSTPRCGLDLNELHIIPDGALLIRDGVLKEVGLSRRVENVADARHAVEINASGKVVMPCFVDCHTHLAYPPPGASDQDRAAATRTIEAATGKRTAARWRVHLEAMVRHGATTAEIKTSVGPAARSDFKVLRMLSKLQCEPLDIVTTFLFRLPPCDESGEAWCDEFTSLVCRELLPKIRRRRWAGFAEVAWNPVPAHRARFQRYLDAACKLGFHCKMHADRGHVAAAIVMAMQYGAVSISHLEHATRSEASLMAGSGIIATLLPCASFHTAAANAPARALVDAGVPIALGSDFHPIHSPTLNMQTVVALACLRLALTPAQAITAATINGAHVLGCAARTGSLEPGKSADVAILTVSDYRDLANHIGTNLVHTTMKGGAVIYREGEVGVRSGPARGSGATLKDTSTRS
jgi:imidazolonepropionase